MWFPVAQRNSLDAFCFPGISQEMTWLVGRLTTNDSVRARKP